MTSRTTQPGNAAGSAWRKVRFFLAACESGVALSCVGGVLVTLQSYETDVFRNLTAAVSVLFPIGMGTRYARHAAHATRSMWSPGDPATPGRIGLPGACLAVVAHYLLAFMLTAAVPRLLHPGYGIDASTLLMWILSGCVGAAVSVLYVSCCNFQPARPELAPPIGIVVSVATPQAQGL